MPQPADRSAPINIDILMAKIRKEVVEARPLNSLHQLELGKLHRFSIDGQIDPFLDKGWAEADEHYRWIEGNSAKLKLPIRTDLTNFRLSILAHSMNGEMHPYQDVFVTWNNNPIAEWRISHRAFFHALILNHDPEMELQSLEFICPTAVSPRSCGESDDPRLLAIAIHTLAIHPI
jgi:hypothetical protein